MKMVAVSRKKTKLKSRADVLPKWRGRVVVPSACALRKHMKAAPVNPRRRAEPRMTHFHYFAHPMSDLWQRTHTTVTKVDVQVRR